MKNDFMEFYIKALKACDDGLIPSNRVNEYATYLQQKAHKENNNAID